MKTKETKGVVTSLLEGFFVAVPTFLARKTLDGAKRIPSLGIQILILAGLSAFSLGFLILLKFFGNVFSLLSASGPNGILTGLAALYLTYLILTFPLFLLLTYAGKAPEARLLEKDPRKEKRKIPESETRKGRAGATKRTAYLGTSFWTGKPTYLTDAMRKMHLHCVGSTGVGKTESVLLPLLRHDIEQGKGAIVIDGKGDLELLAKIRHYVEKAGRRSQFYYFSLSHPEISSTYNPLLRGSASELKDKLVSATEWREEFYRKKAEEALLTLLRPMVELGRRVKFRDLYYLLTDSGNLRTFKNTVGEGPMYHDLQVMENHFGENSKFLSGIIADLALITKSEFGRLVDVEESEIDLLKAYEENQILYFSLSTQAFEETAKRFGRLVLQDLKTVSHEIQTKKPEAERHFFGVFIDEFSSFAYESFIEVLNKGRGAGLAIALFHQSLGDLAAKRTTYQQQILENTNIKIVMRQDDPYSIEKFAKIGGAKRTIVSTYQTEERMLGTGFTGVGSLREGQTFRIDPDLVRALGRGEAIVVTKAPSFRIDYAKLDYEWVKVEEMMEKIKREKEQALERLKQEKLGEAQKKDKKEKPFRTLEDTLAALQEHKERQNTKKAV